MKKTAKYYSENPDARRKKAAYDKRFNRKPAQRRKRSELNQINREAGTYGNRDGMDFDHAIGRFVRETTNRGRREKSRRKGSKRS